MSILHNRFLHSLKLIQAYKGEQTLEAFFSAQFALNKSWGSKDRRFYRDIVYAFFRYYGKEEATIELLENALNWSMEKQTKMGIFNPFTVGVCSVKKTELVPWFRQKGPVSVIGSENILSILSSLLNEQNIAFEKWEHGLLVERDISTVQFPILNELQFMDKGSFSTCLDLDIKPMDLVWDCCAGAGGKTLVLSNVYKCKVISTDVRNSSLQNLERRATVQDIPSTIQVLNASEEFVQFPVNWVFIDAPCTGSGTWRRNPDRAVYFDEQDIKNKQKLQKSIIINISSKASAGTKIVYVTCSVFKAENEAHTATFESNGCKLISSSILGGKAKNADYFYRAIFEKI